jgi:hypothetical protein
MFDENHVEKWRWMSPYIFDVSMNDLAGVKICNRLGEFLDLGIISIER